MQNTTCNDWKGVEMFGLLKDYNEDSVIVQMVNQIVYLSNINPRN